MGSQKSRWVVGAAAVLLALQVDGCTLNSTGEAEVGSEPDASSAGAKADASTGGKGGGTAGGGQGGESGKGGAAGGGAGTSGDGGTSGAAGKGGAGAGGAGEGGAGEGGAGEGGAGGIAGQGGDGGAGGGGGAAETGGSTGQGGGIDDGGADVVDAPDDVVEADSGPVCELRDTAHPDCDACMAVNCMTECQSCAASTECKALVLCIAACSDSSCQKDCWDDHPDGQDRANELGGKDGCLRDHCESECSWLPDTGGSSCSTAAPRESRGTWGIGVLAAVGLAAALVRKLRVR